MPSDANTEPRPQRGRDRQVRDLPHEGAPRPDAKVSGLHSRGRLPHLKREGGTYFVTFRLVGTLPRTVLLQLKAEREAILHQAFAANRPLTWAEQ